MADKVLKPITQRAGVKRMVGDQWGICGQIKVSPGQNTAKNRENNEEWVVKANEQAGVSSDGIRTSPHFILPDELNKHTILEGTKSVTEVELIVLSLYVIYVFTGIAQLQGPHAKTSLNFMARSEMQAVTKIPTRTNTSKSSASCVERVMKWLQLYSFYSSPSPVDVWGMMSGKTEFLMEELNELSLLSALNSNQKQVRLDRPLVDWQGFESITDSGNVLKTDSQVEDREGTGYHWIKVTYATTS
ncbi:hypothetical protein L218DRAFT_951823 [Marasmius fiardii PR-910]|nr:hypothetical protein L218DRAFT_951823 [Marasmius fiardii PR-910]